MNALGNACPLCKGSVLLTKDQQKHWNAFTINHAVAECNDCHAFHLACSEQATKIHEDSN